MIRIRKRKGNFEVCNNKDWKLGSKCTRQCGACKIQ